MGANAALNTNGCNFEQVFPGIRRSSVTLNACFWTPLFREWMLGIGFISANKTTLLQTLQQESVVLVPGGAAEALHAHERIYKFYLQRRQGFCRLAMETSCPLVPCIGFGENEAFATFYPVSKKTTNDNKENTGDDNIMSESSPISSSSSSPTRHSFIWQLQQRLLRCLSFSTPILLNPIPRPHPIHVVVGAPVSPQGCSTVEELHERYLEAVRTLYQQHQNQYGYQDVPLEII